MELQKFIKSYLKPAASLFSSALAFWGGLFFLQETLREYENNAQFIEAPKISVVAELSEHDNRLVWISGTLVCRGGSAPVQSPLSKKECLYYQFLKDRGVWETDSGGESYLAWHPEKKETGGPELMLETESSRLAIDSQKFVLQRTLPVAERKQELDEIPFRFTEYIIPTDNQVTVIGILQGDILSPTDRGLIVSMSGFDVLVPVFKQNMVKNIFFAVCALLGGISLLLVFCAFLVHKKIPLFSPQNVLFVFGSLGYVWVLNGSMLTGLVSQYLEENILAPLIIGIFSSFLFLFPIIPYACRHKFSPAIFIFFPAIGIAVLSGYFYYQVLFATGEWIGQLSTAILMSLFAAGLMILCRVITGRSTA